MSLEVNTSENGEPIAQIHTFIENVAKANNLNDFEYTVDTLSGNFVANIYTVSISNVNKTGETVNVVLKTLVNSIRQEKYREIHKRECLAYNKVVPKLKEIIKSENSKLYLPECQFNCYEIDKEVLVLEQLKEKSFEECRLNRFLMFDVDHYKLVISELAKFHAASFILKEKYKETFEEITKEFKDVIFQDQFLNKTKLRKYFTESFKESVNEVINELAKNKLKRIESAFIRIIQKYLKAAEYNVLCHGDLWMKNIMFLYEEEAPKKICFIDFQAMRYANPITDIYYYLYLNSDYKFRSENKTDLCNMYYESMKEFLKIYEIDVETVFPRKQFEKDLKEFRAYSLLITLIQLKAVTLTPDNEAIDHGSKLTGHTDVNTVPGENVLFNHRVNDLVNEFINNGVLDDIVKNL